MNATVKPLGRAATLALAVFALAAGQMAALLALTWWYRQNVGHLPDFASDGATITLITVVSTPVEVALLTLFVRRSGSDVADYLGLILPRRGEAVVGFAAMAALILVANVLSWLFGFGLVTPFQRDIYISARAEGWLLALWFAIVVVAPVGEELLFRGFLFRGWLRRPGDVWPAIVITSLLWAIIHLQYHWYVIVQIFVFGLLLGWMRWATGSTVLTMMLHALINFEAMVETWVHLKWLT